MKDYLESIGWLMVTIGIVIIIVFVVVFFIKGALWLGINVLPWLAIIMWIVFALDIFIILPLGIFKKTKGAAGIALYISSYVYGLTLWLWGFLLTYLIWGVFAIVIGLFIAGVGIVPIAMLATAIEGEWATTGQIVLLLFLTVSSRMLGIYFTERADELAYRSSNI